MPVVMLTANERLSNIQRASELGVLGYSQALWVRDNFRFMDV